MTEKETRSVRADALRKRAEEKTREKAGRMDREIAAPSAEETRRLLHELRVHQIELEMQNEELRRGQAELEASQARYFELYDLAPVGYLILSEQGLILKANLTVATMLGATRGELVKQPFSHYILPDDQDIYYRHRQQLFETGAPQICEMRMLGKDRASFWARVEAAAARDTGGATVCRAVLTDITGRKKAEEALGESETRYRSLIEGSADGILIADIDTRIFKYANPAICRMLGYTKEEFRTLELKDIHPKDALQSVITQFEEQAQGDITLAPNIPCLRKDGTIFYADINTFSISLEGRMCNVGFFRDITERKQSEAALKRIEWLLRNKPQTFKESYSPRYGNLVSLNTCRLIYDTVGEDTLTNIIGDYLDLLDTSAAVYEKNGDYALGIFSSGWCRFMDTASRQLCDTTNNIKALAGGKWLCHESCWTKASKTSIETGQPTDIECAGGLHLYAVPVRAGKEIVGSLNFGYGDPPRDPAKLQELAAKYDVNFEELRQYAEAYESRPPFIIELAKRRAQVSAKLLGEIIERKQGEKVLQQSEEKYRSLVRAVVDPIMMVAGDGKVLLVNEAKLGLLNKPASDVLDKNILQIMPEKTATAYMKIIKQVLASGDSAVLMNWQKERYFESIFSPITNKKGKAYAVTIVSRDFTDRKLDEEEIEKLARFPSENPNPVLRVANDGTLLYSNKVGELLLKEWKCRMGEALPEEWRTRVAEVLRSGQTTDIEIECGDKSFSLILCPITESGYINIYGIDITERKNAEEALRQSEEQLRQGQKMEAVGRLAGGIAHDFNNLLTAITGFSELTLQQLPEDSPLRADIETIKKAAFRAAALTRQLLAFSRKQALQPQILSLNETIKNLDKMLRRIIGEDRKIVSRLAEKIPRVKADPGQIEQVIMNLMVNARDAMPDGGTITIVTENVRLDRDEAAIIPDARPGSFVRLSLEDTGTGMDPQVIEHIFEPFFTTKKVGEGTGLGLSTVYGIVKQHDGWINVYSEPGQGAVFKVYLPAFDVGTGWETDETGSREPPRGAGEKILVVEDEKGVCDFVVRAFRQYGYEVFAADSIAEGEKIFNEHPGGIDLLFTDVLLPDGSGLRLAQQLRGRQPDLAILLCSGYSDGHFRWTAEDKETFRLLQKPCALNDLLCAVKEVLRERAEKPTGQNAKTR